MRKLSKAAQLKELHDQRASISHTWQKMLDGLALAHIALLKEAGIAFSARQEERAKTLRDVAARVVSEEMNSYSNRRNIILAECDANIRRLERPSK